MAKCRICGRKWAGKSECHCSGCGQHFKSLAGFDKHRVSDKLEGRRCLSPEEMEKRGMVALETPGGLKWVTGVRQNMANLLSPLKNAGFSRSRQGVGSHPGPDSPEMPASKAV